MPRAKVYNYSTEDLIKFINESKTWKEIFIRIGVKSGSYTLKQKNYLIDKVKDKVNLSRFNNGRGWSNGKLFPNRNLHLKIRLEDILVENFFYKSAKLKKRLIKELNWKDECIECGLGNVWNNKPITLQLDHINGNHRDNRIENLRILCPNCHTQTETYGNKNIGNGKHKCDSCNNIVKRRSRKYCDNCKTT